MCRINQLGPRQERKDQQAGEQSQLEGPECLYRIIGLGPRQRRLQLGGSSTTGRTSTCSWTLPWISAL